MQYPLISEYVAAIRDAGDNLDQLKNLVPVPDDHGEPYRSSGAFAVVFKMKDEQTGKCYALKCFTEEQQDRAEAYRQIADELEMIDSPYVTSVKYLEKEFFVDSTCEDDEFPVLMMDWIDGETMEAYIAQNYQDSYAMSMLCYRFCKLAMWLRSQPFAHGDIKPDNIMVRPDGSLTLVDYDGMFVPSMKGQQSPTIGTKDFSHPDRTINDFDETIDDFALSNIALSLKAISLKPSLLEDYGASDHLLFSATDYHDLSKSKVVTALQELMTDNELNTLYSLFLLAMAQQNLAMSSFRLFAVKKPVYVEEVLSTEVTDEDLAEAIEDEYGVLYSKDGKRLLTCEKRDIKFYTIKHGTKAICDGAFWGCFSLTSIDIPDSVTSIGDRAFGECDSLTSIEIPDSVTSIGYSAFSDCGSLTSIDISDSVTSIGDDAFRGCGSLTSIDIPDSVTSIGKGAFRGCRSLTSIDIPDSVTSIGNFAFWGCGSLTSIDIPDSVTSIGVSAFRKCGSLTSIDIPDSVTSIGDSAFWGCVSLTSIDIPDSVTSIGDSAFSGCKSLTSIKISDSVTSIGKYAFRYCGSLTSIEIPDSVTSIGKYAFHECESLISIEIPDSVTSIGDSAFRYCASLTSIEIPDGVTSIGGQTFRGCGSLTSIGIPDSVTSIGELAFDGCCSLTSIEIPDSVTSIGGSAFGGCKSLSSIDIPDGVTSIGDSAFWGCDSLSPTIKEKLIKRFGKKIGLWS